MTTIETFCRVCAEPVDIQVEEADEELRRLMARLGVTCEACTRARRQASKLPRAKQPELRSTHNDP